VSSDQITLKLAVFDPNQVVLTTNWSYYGDQITVKLDVFGFQNRWS